MKKLLLFLSGIIITATVAAQQHNPSVVFGDNVALKEVNDPVPLAGQTPFDHGKNNSPVNARTTSPAAGRWYNYCDYLTTVDGALGTNSAYLWNDSTSVDEYNSGEYLFNILTSVGVVWDPFISGWNDPSAYSGLINITPSNAYTVDSIYINGIYYRNNNKTTPVDTLTIAIFYGDGSTTSSDLHFVARDTVGGNEWIYNQYSTDTLYYSRMHYDSINNRADTFNGGFTPVIQQVLLYSTDTSGNYQLTIPVSIAVPAGNMPAISVSFKSGDTSFTFGDTVFNGAGSSLYKYGMFRPYVQYVGSTSAAIFPNNYTDDENQGEYELQPASQDNYIYYPHWFLVSAGTSNASTLQYPYFAFHATCPTCAILGVNNVTKSIVSVTAFPSPAYNELTVNFSLADISDVSISLVNMLGQVVAGQSINKVSSGKAVFNTTSLEPGVYFCTVQSGGERYVNKVIVAH